MAAEYTTQRLDHLGIVAGICQEIGLAEQIDRIVGPTERQVSVGEAVQAMVLNALGFTARPLYLTPEFFTNKPLDRLLRPGLTAEMLNDDSLGRALDILHEKGETEVFAQVASHALRVYGIEHRFVHLDTTSFSVEGEYDRPEEPGIIRITYGYSRDHRPDLKQVIAALLTTYRSARGLDSGPGRQHQRQPGFPFAGRGVPGSISGKADALPGGRPCAVHRGESAAAFRR